MFEQGREVGKLAQQLFIGGVDASPATPFDYQPSIELTQKLIADGQRAIYEAVFQHDGVLAALDILVKKNDGWYGYEVKSTSSVKDVNVTDAALQYWVMAGSGIELRDISIVHLDTDYERHGEIDVQKLFKTESVLYLVQALQDEITDQVAELKKVAESKTAPKVLIGRQCSNPNTCDFKDHCWKDVTEESILDFTYYRKTEERFKLYHSGIKRIVDVKDWQTLKPPYDSVVEMHIMRGIYIDPDKLKPFMDGLQFPLRFMDFETVAFALPPFDSSGPYDQMSFQYSVHTMEADSAEPVHSAYLADPSKDFREDFIRSLLGDLGDTGSITVWNIGFERSKLNALALLYPQYGGQD